METLQQIMDDSYAEVEPLKQEFEASGDEASVAIVMEFIRRSAQTARAMAAMGVDSKVIVAGLKFLNATMGVSEKVVERTRAAGIPDATVGQAYDLKNMQVTGGVN